MDRGCQVVDAGGTQPDKSVAALARRQWGVVTARELRALGLSHRAIGIRVRKGHLHPLYRGVYAVGHLQLATEGRWLAAVKACGDGAVLSHYSAAALWGLVAWDGRPIDVTVSGAPRHHNRVNVHRTTRPERARHHAVPVTPPARTLDDLSSGLPFKPLRSAVRQAANRGLVGREELARARSRDLRAIAADLQPTRSPLEDTVLDLIRAAGFEDPVINAPVARAGTLYPDFHWPGRRLIIEADGGTHANDLARHDDAQRTARLGERVVRISYREAERRPDATIRRLRALEATTRPADRRRGRSPA